ncbi:hypothetical protein BH24ACT20_BH24ACT20_06670 [soil metagenome]
MNEKLEELLPDIDLTDHNPLDQDQLAIRIERTYQVLEAQRTSLTEAERKLANIEAHIKGENSEEYTAAKNADARQVLVQSWLHDEPEYWETRNTRDEASDLIELIRVRIDRLKLLVALTSS